MVNSQKDLIMRFLFSRHHLPTVFLISILMATHSHVALCLGQIRPAGNQGGTTVRDYQSRNFLVHTDLSPAGAQDLLKRLETMLSLISRYWGKPNRQQIECFVVKDLSKWPAGSLDPKAIPYIQGKAGVTLSSGYTRGNQVFRKAKVYAISDRGTPQHEAVHAYCSQTFGRTGPVWYSEGMAEMGQYWKAKDPAVNADPVVVNYLKKAKPKSLNEIVNGKEFTGDSWQNYAWRWALCHLLATNKNYSTRFRPLGLGLLTQQNVSFEKVYGSMAEEISFEYLFFLKHLERGYRVDLCSWDWKTRFQHPSSNRFVTAKINAMSGWQATRASVKKGHSYLYETQGSWQIEAKGEKLTADGNDKSKGKLMGVIFNDYQLSEPFALGSAGTFTAESDGKLYVRCQDDWNSLGDNSGYVTLKCKRKLPGSESSSNQN